MPSKSPLDGINNTELRLTNQIGNPDISDELTQAFVRLLGYDPNAKMFRLIKTNSNGQLSVSTNSNQGSDASYTQNVILASSDEIVLAANPNRVYYEIRSTAYGIYIGTGLTLPYSRIHYLPPNSTFFDDDYVGDVSVSNLVAQNQTIEVVEVFTNANN